ncbi:MAG: hypothetical protein WB760_08295 [Xanthobacteraceae bacterium]
MDEHYIGSAAIALSLIMDVSYSYPWRDGMYLTYEIRTDAPDLATKGKRVDATLQNFLEKMLLTNRN